MWLFSCIYLNFFKFGPWAIFCQSLVQTFLCAWLVISGRSEDIIPSSSYFGVHKTYVNSSIVNLLDNSSWFHGSSCGVPELALFVFAPVLKMWVNAVEFGFGSSAFSHTLFTWLVVLSISIKQHSSSSPAPCQGSLLLVRQCH